MLCALLLELAVLVIAACLIGVMFAVLLLAYQSVRNRQESIERQVQQAYSTAKKIRV